MTGRGIYFKQRAQADDAPLRFGGAPCGALVFDSAADELTLQTTNAAGTLTDRLALKAGVDAAPIVFNDPGLDVDVRSEGDNDPNLLFLDASVDRVGIGTATPGTKLDVNGGARSTTIEGTDATDATSTVAAAMKTAGGLAVVKDAYIGARLLSGAAAANTRVVRASKYTSGVSTPAVTIFDASADGGTNVSAAWFCIVSGKPAGTGDRFTDLVMFGYASSIAVIYSFTNYGSPAARTYSKPQDEDYLQLAMGAGTYNVSVYAIQGGIP